VSVLAPGLVTAVAQEVVFRGAVLGLLLEAGAGPVTAVVLTAVAFAATRVSRGRLPTAAALVAGLVLGTLALLTGGVAVPVAVHAAALVVVAGLDMRAARVSQAAATAGVGCGGHDPSSPACQACPLAPAASAVAAR
jgi:membrane protease YdiL (CAAX protease family)